MTPDRQMTRSDDWTQPGRLVTSPLYPGGLQFEWYAVDRGGFVAIFNTAGCGPAPEAMVVDEPAWERTDSALWSLPERFEARRGPGKWFDSEFEQIARRGMFAYDWSDVANSYTDLSARYELQAYPVQPLPFTSLGLSQEVADWIAVVKIDRLFAEADAIDLRTLLSAPCAYAHQPAPPTG